MHTNKYRVEKNIAIKEHLQSSPFSLTETIIFKLNRILRIQIIRKKTKQRLLLLEFPRIRKKCRIEKCIQRI